MRRGGYWLLDGHEPRWTASLDEWSAQVDDHAARRVGRDQVGGVGVSTVFLGVDHNWDVPGGPPLLFETMTFGEPFDEYCWRYSTWDEAQAGHDAVVAALRAGTDLPE